MTGRRLLRSAYADDRHLRARMSIYAYAATRVDPAWRTAFVHWEGTQVVADVGCGNGLDLRRLIGQRRCRHIVGIDLSMGMPTAACSSATHEYAPPGPRCGR